MKQAAVIHDWLNGMRGGERVLEEILALLPDADLFTLIWEPEKVSEAIRRHRVIDWPRGRTALVRRYYPYFLPQLPGAIESFDLAGYPLVVSSSHCVAKGVIPEPGARHIAYLHSPMRYAWDQFSSYFGTAPRWKRALVAGQMVRLRMWDVASSARVDRFVANSEFVRERIHRYYRREAEVIPPPIDTAFFTPDPGERRGDFLLCVSALVPYKNIAFLVDHFTTVGKPLVVVGGGPLLGSLRRRAGKTVTFRSFQSREELRTLYRRARALVFAGVEDFGMAFAEAISCGTPVVALGRGGVRDIVRDGENGLLFAEATSGALAGALERLDGTTFDPGVLHRSVSEFGREHFSRRFAQVLQETVP